MVDIVIDIPDETIDALAQKAKLLGKPLAIYIREIFIAGADVPEDRVAKFNGVNVEVHKGSHIAKGLPERQGQKWSLDEDELASDEYRAGSTIVEIAKRHQRTKGAIVSRLARLGLIQPTYRDPT